MLALRRRILPRYPAGNFAPVRSDGITQNNGIAAQVLDLPTQVHHARYLGFVVRSVDQVCEAKRTDECYSMFDEMVLDDRRIVRWLQ